MPYQQPRVPIGARREKVKVQQAVTEEDGMGGQNVIRWNTIAEPWCQVTALDERDKESVEGGQLVSNHAYHIVMPYRANITPRLRIIVRDTTMEIHTVVDDDGRRKRLTLQVGEIQ